ncbi:MAG: TRAP transporter small permease [Gammaproteobacteria bacterium]
MSDAAGRLGDRLERAGRLLEDLVLIVLLSAMMLLATAQILLRNVFDSGFIWADEVLKLMVLWLALFGAVAASRADKHISIDVVSRFLSPSLRLVSQCMVNAFTTVVCVLLAWHSARFVYSAWEFGDELVGGLPAWWFQIVMPIAFALIAWRYLLFTGSAVLRLGNRLRHRNPA